MRLIDADALVERLKFKRSIDRDMKKYNGLESAISQINKMPTVDIKTEVARCGGMKDKYIDVGMPLPYRPETNTFMDISEKHILDATCGSRTIWFQKDCPLAVYMDCREEHDMAIWKSTKNDSVRTLDVEPDVVADFTTMPFEDNSFELVVFDPPHLKQVGENAWMRKKYGKLPEDWPKLIHDGFGECMRVLKPFGTLIFKWSEVQIPTREVINAIGKEPLFGHRSGKQMNTHWLCYMKTPTEKGGAEE